jgi:hypothetical protein
VRMTAAEYRADSAKPKKPSKYRNVPVTVDGIRFASKREAAYYCELKLREKAGEVSGLSLQRTDCSSPPTSPTSAFGTAPPIASA